MMDAAAAEEIPHSQSVEPGLDGKMEWTGDPVSKVLGDDNLLREIIVRVGFPTTLVRAALVCKRWLGHAADPAFLCRFRKLHPPCLLGYYLSEWPFSSENLGAPPFHLMLPQPLPPEFFGPAPVTTGHLSGPCIVPMLPQPPELATVIRHLADYRFGAHDGTLLINHCQNGTIFTKHDKRETELTLGVHRQLCPERGMPIVPPFPCVDRNLQWFSAMLSKEGGDGGLSYLYVLGTKDSGKFLVRVYVLQDGVWCLHTSATCQPCLIHWEPKAVLVDNKIYIPSGSDEIVVLDLTTSSFSTIQLPQGVSYNYFRTMLSVADDASGVYLIHVNGFQLRLWLSKGDSWLLVDTICLRMLDHTLEDEHNANVQISQVGNNAEFVFLRMGGCTLYLDVMSKTLRKVHEKTQNDLHFSDAKPFMMIWPPIFPVLKDDPARNVM